MKAIISFFISIFIVNMELLPCTIFKTAKNSKVFAVNNEDYVNPITMVFFYPAEKGKYGRIYFGYNNNMPQGGMNDQGLFYDWVAGSKTGWVPSSEKQDYYGNISEKILETCANIEEAIELYKKYNYDSFAFAHTMLVDKTGASVIVGWQNGKFDFVRSASFCQIIGNKEKIAEKMLEVVQKDEKELSVNFIESILKIVHEENLYPTQYSNIYDLKNKIVYVYQFHDYNHVKILDLTQELKRGQHEYFLNSLFPENSAAIQYRDDYNKKLAIKGKIFIENYEEVRRNHLNWSEEKINKLGIDLLSVDELEKSIEILKLNIEVFPKSADAQCTLAQVYFWYGDKGLANIHCQKSPMLNPKNESAIKLSKAIESK